MTLDKTIDVDSTTGLGQPNYTVNQLLLMSILDDAKQGKVLDARQVEELEKLILHALGNPQEIVQLSHDATTLKQFVEKTVHTILSATNNGINDVAGVKGDVGIGKAGTGVGNGGAVGGDTGVTKTDETQGHHEQAPDTTLHTAQDRVDNTVPRLSVDEWKKNFDKRYIIATPEGTPEGYTMCTLDGHPYLLTSGGGRVLGGGQYDAIVPHATYVVATRDGKSAIFNYKGEVVLQTLHDTIEPCRLGFVVTDSGKKRLLDYDGHDISLPACDNITVYDNCIVVTQGDFDDVYTDTGSRVDICKIGEYLKIVPVRGGYIVKDTYKKYGLLDMKGEFLLPCDYMMIDFFASDEMTFKNFLMVKKNQDTFEEFFNLVTQKKHFMKRYAVGRTFFTFTDSDKKHILNADGMKYDCHRRSGDPQRLSLHKDFENIYIINKSDDRSHEAKEVIDIHTMKVIVPGGYSEISTLGNRYIAVTKNIFREFLPNQKFQGLFTKDGVQILDAVFHSITLNGDQIYVTTKNPLNALGMTKTMTLEEARKHPLNNGFHNMLWK